MAIPKFITAEEAAALVKDGDTVGTSGFVGMGHAEELTAALEKRFLETGSPKDLTVTWGASQSNTRDRVGNDRFSHPGFVKRAVVGHIGMQRHLSAMAVNNEFEAYNFPQGILLHMYRARAGKKPCITTPIGLGTFVDPRETGGKLNQLTVDNGPDYVKLVEIDGEEFLQFKTFDVDVAIVRGTTADEKGNITMEHEGIIVEALTLALAARGSGGIVIAQVERVVKSGTLYAQNVKIPGVAVDYIVKCSDVEKYHKQTYARQYDPALSGELKVPVSEFKQLPLDARKIISRRSAMELTPDAVVNLGVGIPSEVGAIAAEEGLGEQMTLTVEPGIVGGIPCSGLDFGCAHNPEAMIDHTTQFDFYDGGGLDLAVLGMAELDAEGNVNASKFGPKAAGAGGFVNIAENTKTVVFAGAFTAGGLEIKTGDGKLEIINEGKAKKLIPTVEHKTFSGAQSRKRGQKIVYVTERAVFEMRPEGLTLTEVAPGIDLETQVLGQMEFTPIIASDLKPMDERIFRDEPMNIYDEIMSKR